MTTTARPLRIAFMGTPDFAVPALSAIQESAHELICLYTQPPRPKGRGQKVQISPTHEYAERNNIPVYHPKSLKGKEQQKEFSALNLDVAIVAAYGLILPTQILNAPIYGCINIHASLLPRWRGASPIQRAIWSGDSESGVTLMQMDEGLDTGPEISKRSTPITINTTAQNLHDELATMGGEMVLDVLQQLSNGNEISATKQIDSLSTYAPLLKKEDGLINWNQSAQEIDCQIRALNPWPGTYIESFKIKAANLSDQTTDQKAGIILDKNGHIACGNGTVIKINQLQPAGKKPMDFKSALNGGYLEIGKPLK